MLDHCAVDLDAGEELFMRAVEEMVESVPHSHFYPPEEVISFKNEVKGKRIGLGIRLIAERGGLFVSGTAFKSQGYEKLAAGDEIIEIEGHPTKNMTLDDAYTLMRGDGKKGTCCALKVIKAVSGNTDICSIVRTEINIPSVLGRRIPDETSCIGYINICCFQTRTFSEFLMVYNSLKERGVESLILDLRFNPGGVLEGALKIANFFVAEGILLKTRGRHPDYDKTYSAIRKRCNNPKIRLAVLINNESASAAEVLAGVLQDHERATLIGTESCGKGVTQATFDMEFLGKPVKVKIPTALCYLPSGRCVEKEQAFGNPLTGGLKPDIIITLCAEDKRRIKKRIEIEREALPCAPLTGTGIWNKEELFPDSQLEAAVSLMNGDRAPASDKKK